MDEAAWNRAVQQARQRGQLEGRMRVESIQERTKPQRHLKWQGFQVLLVVVCVFLMFFWTQFQNKKLFFIPLFVASVFVFYSFLQFVKDEGGYVAGFFV